MGTTVSIDVQPPLVATRSSTRSSSDSTTSTPGSAPYRADSEVSRLADGDARGGREPRRPRTSWRPATTSRSRPAARSTRGTTARRAARPVRLRQGLGDRGGRLADRQRRRPQLLDQRRRRHRGPRRGGAGPAVAGRDPPPGPGRQGGRGAGRLRPGRRDLRLVRARRAHRRPADRCRRRPACGA